MPIISNAYVDGMARIGWASRQFDHGHASRRSRKSQQLFLHREVPGVKWSAELSEGQGERDRQRATQGHAKCDPQVQRSTETEASLDLAYPRLIDPSPRSEDALRDTKSPTCGANGLTKRQGIRRGQTLGLPDRFSGSASGRCGLAHEWHSYDRAFTRAYTTASRSITLDPGQIDRRHEATALLGPAMRLM